MANEVRIVIRGDNQSDGAFDQATRDARRLDGALDDAADAAQNLADAAGDSGDAVSDAMSGASGATEGLGGAAGGAGGLLDKLGPVGKGAAAAVGVAMAAAALAVKGLESAIGASIQRASDLGRMKAQLLLSPADAAKYAKIAAKVYTDNWGSTLEEASDYVRDAALYIMPSVAEMKGAAQPSLDAVAERVAALATTMDEDGKKVASTIQHMLVTGMAKSADEAFNLLHAGIAKGVNSADDLLDTFIEYSTEFRALGLNGQQAMGLLSQGLKTGARDADTVADGLKEIAIRAKDGSAGSKAAFKAIGLDADKLGADFAAGGDRASGALSEVIDKLRGVKDPMQQSAIATALFGTKAEDLQQALFGLDMHTAVTGLGDIANAADVAGAHMSGNAYSAIEAYRRRWQMFQADMGDRFLPVFERVMQAISAFADRVGPRVQEFLADLQKKWDANKDRIAEFGDMLETVLGVVGPAVIGLIILAIDTLVDAVILIGGAWDRVKNAFVTSASIILTVLGTIVHGAATAFGWMPEIGPKLKNAAADFDGFAGRVNRALASIVDKTVHVNVVSNAPLAQGSTGHASTWKIAATGGLRTGLTVVGDRGPELLDLGAGARVINNNTAQHMVTAGGQGGGGATMVSVGGAGNSAGMMAGALNTLLRYMINNNSIPLRADLRTGQVKVA